MFCTKCGSKIALSENFCKVCGAKVTAQCPQCGNRLENNEKFCTKCGTQVGTQVAKQVAAPTAVAPTVTTTAPVQQGNSDTSASDFFQEQKKFLWANVILLALSLILSFTKVVGIRAEFFGLSASESTSLTFSETEYAGVISLIFIAAYLPAIICIILPLLSTNKNNWSPAIFIPTKIVTILSFCWFLMILLILIAEGKDDFLSSIVTINISVSGWLYVFSTIGALVLAFKNSNALKQHQLESALAKAMSQQRYI